MFFQVVDELSESLDSSHQTVVRLARQSLLSQLNDEEIDRVLTIPLKDLSTGQKRAMLFLLDALEAGGKEELAREKRKEWRQLISLWSGEENAVVDHHLLTWIQHVSNMCFEKDRLRGEPLMDGAVDWLKNRARRMEGTILMLDGHVVDQLHDAPDVVVVVDFDRHGLIGNGVLRRLREIHESAQKPFRVIPEEITLSYGPGVVQDLSEGLFGVDAGALNDALAFGQGFLSSRAVSDHPTSPRVEHVGNVITWRIKTLDWALLEKEVVLAPFHADKAVVWSSAAVDGDEQHALTQSYVRAPSQHAGSCVLRVSASNISFSFVDPQPQPCAFLPEWHFEMVRDRVRNDAFASAIERLPACTHIVDAGTGPLALLSVLAARRGSTERITAIEVIPQLHGLATTSLATNVAPQRVSLLLDNALTASIDPPADVLMAELLDAAGVGEHFLGIVRSMWTRKQLVPHARVLPRRLRLTAQLIRINGRPDISALATRGEYVGVRLDDSDRDDMCAQRDWSPVSDQVVAFDFCLDNVNDWTVPVTHVLSFACKKGATHCDAVAWWFDAWLDDTEGGPLSNAPHAPVTHWAQAVARFDSPIAAAPLVSIQATTDGKSVRWVPVNCSFVEPSVDIFRWRKMQEVCESLRAPLTTRDPRQLELWQRAALSMIACPGNYCIHADAIDWLKKQFFS